MKNLKVGVASIALIWTGQAYAQTASTETAGTGAEAAAAPESPAPAETQENTASGERTLSLDQVTVTAQKRSERLVDVPVTVSAVSGETLALAGPDSLTSLNTLVPGVRMDTPVYFLSPTIRGIGSTLSVNNESNAAIYIDGVYQPAQASNVFDLASVAGVEVLKGPQGTLFGRNATGGAILVTTLDPTFERNGKFAISYARFNELRAKGYINAPISDKAAANLAVSYKHTDGYIEDIRTGQLMNEAESFAARGKILLQPTDDLEIILTGSHTTNDDPTPSSSQNLGGRNALGAVPGSGPIASERDELSHDVEDAISTSAQEFNTRINYDVGDGRLSSITAIKRDTLKTVNDADNTYLPVFRVDFTFQNNTITQELNYTKQTDNFSYVVGAYYFHNNRYYAPFQYNQINFLNAEITTDAWAGYADGTYEIGNLSLIAGIRYSSENRKMDNAMLIHPLVPAPGSRSIEEDEDAWTPRFGVRYALSENANVYATYTQGFKSGSFNATSLTDPGVTPEGVDAYEVGYKLATGRFAFNSAAFYYNYEDIQANTLIITSGVALNSVVNAAEAEIKGFEFDATYQATDALNIRAAFGYTDAEYTSFPNAPGYLQLGGGANTTVPVDASGNQMVRSPKYQASSQINYSVPIGGKTLNLTLSPSYTSTVYFDFANQLKQGPVFLLDASAALDLENGMKLSVFGRNITDRDYFTTMGFSTLSIATRSAKPATYGIEFSYDF